MKTMKEQLRDRRHKINSMIDAARAEATYRVLRSTCHEVDITLESRFCGCPVMIAAKCPNGKDKRCDACDYMVQYSLKNKKVYCIDKRKEI